MAIKQMELEAQWRRNDLALLWTTYRCIGECFARPVNWFHCFPRPKPRLLRFSHQLLLPCTRENSIRFLTVPSFKSFVCYSERNSICALSSTAFSLPINAHKASNQFQFTGANCGRKRWRWFLLWSDLWIFFFRLASPEYSRSKDAFFLNDLWTFSSRYLIAAQSLISICPWSLFSFQIIS